MAKKKVVIPLTDEQRKLVEDNIALIDGYIHKYKIKNKDEVYSILAIGLCKAAQIYDSNKGNFSTIAYRYMDYEMKHDWLYANKKSRIPSDKIISYNYSRSDYDYNWKDKDYDNYLDYLTAPFNYEPDTESAAIDNELLNQIKCKIKKKQLIVFDLLLQGFNRIEISKKLGCSSQNVDQYVNTIKNKIKGIVENYEIQRGV